MTGLRVIGAYNPATGDLREPVQVGSWKAIDIDTKKAAMRMAFRWPWVIVDTLLTLDQSAAEHERLQASPQY